MAIKRKKRTLKKSITELEPIQVGNSLAIIYLRETKCGISYLEYKLRRKFIQNTGEIQRRNLLARDRESQHKAIDLAADFLEKYQHNPQLALEAARDKSGTNNQSREDNSADIELVVRDAA